MSSFAENLKKVRIDKGWNQGQLAQAIGVSQTAISQFEKGLRFPTPANINKFAEILESTVTICLVMKIWQMKIKLMRSMHGLSPEGLKKVEEFIKMVKKYEEPGDSKRKKVNDKCYLLQIVQRI